MCSRCWLNRSLWNPKVSSHAAKLIACKLANPNMRLWRAAVPQRPLPFGWPPRITDNHLIWIITRQFIQGHHSYCCMWALQLRASTVSTMLHFHHLFWSFSFNTKLRKATPMHICPHTEENVLISEVVWNMRWHNGQYWVHDEILGITFWKTKKLHFIVFTYKIELSQSIMKKNQ